MPDRRRGAPLPEDIAARIPVVDRIGSIVCQANGDAVEILMHGEIGWDVTALGVREALKAAGETTSVTCSINSGGGFVFEGFAIYNALARHKGDVTMVVDGLAASMASLICMAGNTIQMPTNSFMMVHNPSGLVWGEAVDMREMADLLDKLRSPMLATYAARTGNTTEDIAAMMDATTWMNAEDAKAAGFCDQVESPVEVKAFWDLSALSNVPAALTAIASASPWKPPPRGEPKPAPQPVAKQELKMDPIKLADPPPSPAAPVKATLAQIQAIAARAKLDSDWIVAQLAAGHDETQVRDAAIDAVAARAPAPIASRPATEVVAERTKKFDAMANALAHRAMPGKTKLDDGAREFRGMTLVQMAAECLQDAGIKTRGMTPMEIAEMALGNPMRTFRGEAGAHSTSDFPNLLANTASKTLRQAYTEAPRTFTVWATQHNLPDFKDYKEIALGSAPNLAQIREDGEVTYGTIGEGAETWRLLRYGKAIAITYVAMVNDDLNGFTRIPALFASAASRLESDIVYGTLLANAALADGVAVFAAGHGNLLTGAGTSLTADATGITNVGKLATLLAKQVSPGTSSAMNLQGAHILVPPSQAPAAMALWARNLVPNLQAQINPYIGSYDVISEARLELGANGQAGSATAWYLIADPSQIDTMHYGYLQGEEGPRMTQDIDFDTDGISMKVVHNFGAKVIDYRGMAKSNGA